MDKGGELGEVFDEVTTSDLEGVNLVSANRILGSISTELLRERDGVGGSVARLSNELRVGGWVCM